MNTTGSNNTEIGSLAQVPNVAGSNQVRIGDVAVAYAGIQVAWTITSDKRWKQNIMPANLGLDFISKLCPVVYTRNNDASSKTEYGFIAQEVEEALNSLGAGDSGIISKDDAGMLGMRYNDLLSPMVKAMQELNESLKVNVQSLKQENKSLQSAVGSLQTENQTLKAEMQTPLSIQQKEIEKIKQQLGMEAKK